jgi:hypothetical protein
MAGKPDKHQAMDKPIDDMTNEEMQAAILRIQLRREMMMLEKTSDELNRNDENKVALRVRNEQRQSELAAINKKQESIQKQCRHKQGGQHQNILKGDGKPAVQAMKMLDGYTIRLSCQRCRKTVFTPNPTDELDDPAAYKKAMEEYEDFLELFEDSGLDMIRGPEFMFMRKGVPFVPARV